MYFNAENSGFYPLSEKPLYDKVGTWPADAVEMTAEEQATYYMQTAPAGKRLGSANGRPAWVDIPVTLADAQTDKLRELTAAYSSAMTAPIEYGGFVWNGDERALQALDSAIRLYAECGVPEGYERWDIENILRPMDYDGLLEMRRKIDERAASLAVTFRQRKDAVVAALSAEMVSLVVW